MHSQDTDFRDWFLTKLLNAETKCYHASSFLKLAVSVHACVCVHVVQGWDLICALSSGHLFYLHREELARSFSVSSYLNSIEQMTLSLLMQQQKREK